MRSTATKLKKLFSALTFVLTFTFAASAQTADVQIIHNAAAPAFDTVDVFVNGNIFLEDVAFQTATGFTQLDAGVEYEFDIAPNNAGIESSVYNVSLTLEDGETYYVVATGVNNPSTFLPNPDEVSTGFMLDVIAGGKQTATDGMVDFMIYHGATDAPSVDVVTGGNAIASGLSYTDATEDYISVPASSYILDINVAGTMSTAATFEADLSTLGGSAAIVLASGFLTPAGNQNGAAFGLIAVLPDGTVVTLPAVTTSMVQIIHNAAAPAFDTVDVFVNGDIFLEDFAFRTATPFTELESNVPYEFDIAPKDAGIEASVFNTTLALAPAENYYVVATGVNEPSSFADNPDDVSTAFTLNIVPEAKLMAGDMNNFDFKIFHGASDAPSVDIAARGVAELSADVPYTGYTPEYISVPAASYTIDIIPSGTENTLVAYTADVSTLAGSSGMVLASGFLTPADNQDGAGFGLMLALTDGTTAMLPTAELVSIESDNEAPSDFKLNQNYPNPFNPSTNIAFQLPVSANVTLEVYDMMGRKVGTLLNNEMKNAGSHTFTFNASELASGMYMYRLTAGEFVQTRLMSLIK